MDKFLAYILLGLMVTTVYTSVQLVTGDDRGIDEAPVHSSMIQAHDLAVSGIEYAMMKLEEDRNWANGSTPATITIPGVLIEAAPTDVRRMEEGDNDLENARFVTSSSYIENSMVTVKAIIEAPLDPQLPGVLRYALFSGSRLKINEQLLVLNQAHLPRNTNIHTNGHLAIRGSSLVEGFGTYSSTLAEDKGFSARVFAPNVRGGAIGVYHHPSILPPEIDVKRWQSIATRSYASSTTLSRDLKIGTAAEPGIWLIKGHLDLRACLQGTGILLVEGDLRMNGKTAQDLLKNEHENLCIVVAGNVFAEDAKVSASIICGGSFRASGNVILVGSLLAHGEVQNTGTLDIYYRPLPPELAANVWEPTIQPPRIVMYYE
jgi:hypothetical protein